MFKLPQNVQTTTQLHSFHVNKIILKRKIMLKIHQARLQQYVNQDLLDVKAWFRKIRGTRDQIANIYWIIEKARKFQKKIYFCFIDYAKAFDLVDNRKLQKILKRGGNTRLPYLPLENLYAGREGTVRTGHGTTNWFQIGKDVHQVVYFHPAYWITMQSKSWEMLSWMKQKLESRLPGKISIASDKQMTPA